VRLLPNARVAVSAAGWPPGRLTGRVLVADATRAPGGEPLRRSGQEAEALVRRYGARRLCDATSETVLPALDTAALVHFFCHGRGDLADPLSSGLRLMDGWMTVRALFSRRPLRPQLVILSACESQLGGQAAPDEIIGLPAALFQAGAAGVIASQWKVSEQAALLIMRKFYDQLDAGASPARALTTAQNWLRTATKDELIAAYPSLFTVARRAPGRRLPGEEPPYGNPVHWAAFTYTGI
jgi:CHAT domain-containing protein